ncbi:MAG: class I SAM-dependent methyltransferase [Mangrovibacterium sp.]
MEEFDPIGEAVFNYHFKKDKALVYVHSVDFDTDEMQIPYFFRKYEDMPPLERYAMQSAKGRVLDIGACAGCHSVYLENKGCEVVALERSEKCVAVLQDRGVAEAIQADFYNFKSQPFDTILLLMNGVGIAGTLDNLPTFFSKLKTLLKPDGRIFMDSSDLIYLYENEDGSADINIAGKYYGELTYQTEYKRKKSKSFSWLYADYNLLKPYVDLAGFQVESVQWGEHYDYLLTIKHK